MSAHLKNYFMLTIFDHIYAQVPPRTPLFPPQCSAILLCLSSGVSLPQISVRLRPWSIVDLLFAVGTWTFILPREDNFFFEVWASQNPVPFRVFLPAVGARILCRAKHVSFLISRKILLV